MSRTLFVGDVHGCSKELERLLRKSSPTRVILMGDLFTKGPDPLGVWRLIQHWNAEAVLGNQDEVVLDTWKAGRDLPNKAFRWLKDRPTILKHKHWIAVHAGIHPEGLKRTKRVHALHMRRIRHKHKHPYWWRLYRGKRLVIHGHDAATGLNDRRPYTLGLDTGCVRGGRLTGYLLEADQLVSVKARRSYA